MLLRVTWSLALAFILAASAEARQGHSSKWWQSELVATELGLTAGQADEIEAIFQATLPALRVAKDELDREEATLSNLIARRAVEELEVARQIDRVEAARSAMSKTRTLMLFRMHRVLTPEQRIKLKALHERGHQRSLEHRP